MFRSINYLLKKTLFTSLDIIIAHCVFVQVKKGILNLLIDSDIPLEDKYIHYVVASIDTHTDLMSIGKERVKLIFQ